MLGQGQKTSSRIFTMLRQAFSENIEIESQRIGNDWDVHIVVLGRYWSRPEVEHGSQSFPSACLFHLMMCRSLRFLIANKGQEETWKDKQRQLEILIGMFMFVRFPFSKHTISWQLDFWAVNIGNIRAEWKYKSQCNWINIRAIVLPPWFDRKIEMPGACSALKLRPKFARRHLEH